MPPFRTTANSASPPASDSPQYPGFASGIPSSQYYDTPPSPSQKKKRSHGKARPAGHIPRPPNAFIIFRTDQIKAMETQNSTPEVSKSLGEQWRQMSDAERRPYIERAKLAKLEHQIRHPDYKYKPIHPRDEFGNCIRKPRNPNRPRVNKKPTKSDDNGDLFEEEQLGDSLRWFEGQQGPMGGAAFINAVPPSPSLPPSTPAQLQSNLVNYSIPRRPSSVPLPMPTNTAWADLPQATYLSTQMGYYPSRRMSKRPSTSMDFVNAHGTHAIQTSYALSNALGDQFSQHAAHHQQLQQLQQPQHHHHHPVQWHMGHRRSLSAPNFGELEMATQFSHYPTTLANYSAAAEANTLTPIDPMFSNVFSNFTWSTDTQSGASSDNSNNNIQIPKLPPMGTTPTSSNPSTNSSHIPTASSATQAPDRLIYHPAPVPPTLHTLTFQDHVKQLETAASAYQFEDLIAQAARAENVGFDNMLGLSVPDSIGQSLQHQQQQQQQQPSTAGYVGHDQQNDTNTQPSFPHQHQHHQHHHHQQIAPPRPLDFNELIVEGY